MRIIGLIIYDNVLFIKMPRCHVSILGVRYSMIRDLFFVFISLIIEYYSEVIPVFCEFSTHTCDKWAELYLETSGNKGCPCLSNRVLSFSRSS
jgi:hypothetical protein